MEKHKTSPLLRCLQATALLLNNTVFLLRNYQLIVAMQKFDVLKTNVGHHVWHTLPHYLLTLVPLLYGAKGVCIFRPLVSVLRALNTSTLCHCDSICHSSSLADLFHLFWNISCFLNSLAGSRRGLGWLITVSCSFLRFPLLTSNLN